MGPHACPRTPVPAQPRDNTAALPPAVTDMHVTHQGCTVPACIRKTDPNCLLSFLQKLHHVDNYRARKCQLWVGLHCRRHGREGKQDPGTEAMGQRGRLQSTMTQQNFCGQGNKGQTSRSGHKACVPLSHILTGCHLCVVASYLLELKGTAH